MQEDEVVLRVIACPLNTELVWIYQKDSACHTIRYQKKSGDIIRQVAGLTEAQATVRFLKAAENIGVFDK